MSVGGNNALPPPLSKEEEKEILIKINNGDYNARSKLIEGNLRLVVYVARKFENIDVYVEDLISVGTIGLIKAVDTFPKSNKIQFNTYASRCIENEMLIYLRRNNKIKAEEIQFYQPISIDFSNISKCKLNELIGNEVDDETLMRAVNRLNDREKEIIILRCGLNGTKGNTQKEMSDILGISESYIERLEKKIIKRIKKEINFTEQKFYECGEKVIREIKCKSCGNKLLPNSKFCDQCGARVDNAQSSKIQNAVPIFTEADKDEKTESDKLDISITLQSFRELCKTNDKYKDRLNEYRNELKKNGKRHGLYNAFVAILLGDTGMSRKPACKNMAIGQGMQTDIVKEKINELGLMEVFEKYKNYYSSTTIGLVEEEIATVVSQIKDIVEKFNEIVFENKISN